MIRYMFILILMLGMTSIGRTDDTKGRIQGTVYGASQWDINKLIDQVEMATPQNESELMAILQKEGKPYLINKRLAGITVVLQGKSGKIETLTDNKGNYVFQNIPFGKYTISVEVPNCPGIVDSNKRVATCQETIDLNANNQNEVVYLKPDLFRVDVQGLVTTAAGKPIAGAIVKATKHFSRSDRHLEGTGTPVWTAVTDKNGEYVIKNLPAANYLRLAGHLLSSKRSLDNVVDIEVSAPGYYMQEKPVRIPLVSEENLFIARRFAKIIAKMEKISSGNTLTERKELIFPKSSKNVISDVDFILTAE